MNILKAVEAGASKTFLEILDNGFKQAAREASAESHAMGLYVTDGHNNDLKHRKATHGDVREALKP